MPIYLSVLGACAAKRYGVAARSIRGWKKQEAQLKSTVDLVTSQGGVSMTMALRKRIIPIETTPLVPMIWEFSPGFLSFWVALGSLHMPRLVCFLGGPQPLGLTASMSSGRALQYQQGLLKGLLLLGINTGACAVLGFLLPKRKKASSLFLWRSEATNKQLA